MDDSVDNRVFRPVVKGLRHQCLLDILATLAFNSVILTSAFVSPLLLGAVIVLILGAAIALFIGFKYPGPISKLEEQQQEINYEIESQNLSNILISRINNNMQLDTRSLVPMARKKHAHFVPKITSALDNRSLPIEKLILSLNLFFDDQEVENFTLALKKNNTLHHLKISRYFGSGIGFNGYFLEEHYRKLSLAINENSSLSAQLHLLDHCKH